MFFALEIGGTKLQMALGSGHGALEALWREKVDPSGGGEGIRRQIARALPGFLSEAGFRKVDVIGAGIGFGGPVDTDLGETITSHQIHGWDRFPLKSWLSDQLGCRVELGNDADVAGLGEALRGAGQGASPVFYVTVGSGIGGGYIVDGKIVRGAGKGAAEIGHLRLGPEGDILEHHASGWGIQNRFRRRFEKGESSILVPGPDLSVPLIASAAARGDGLAQSVLGGAITDLAWGLCQVIALVCPRKIVIGGGVSLLGEQAFFEPLRREVDRLVFRPFAGLTQIVPAALGEEVVLHGAIELAKG